MLNVFLFIRRYANFLFFLLLQAFSIWMIVHYNRYHNAVGSTYMNEITGTVNKQYNKVDNFLQLKEKNDSLLKENERLKNGLVQNFERPDTVSKVVSDTIPYDTLGHYRKWLYQRAKVVSNSVTAQNNYVVINRGTDQQLQKDQGVVDPQNAVIGIVTDVSSNYAVVMSLLHKDSKISAILKNDPNGGGSIVWDGKEANYLSFINVRQTAKAKKGDTVITSRLSTTFPYGMPIGIIDQITPDKSTNNYIIRVRSAANFYNLQYAYAIKNFQKDEINTLLEKVKTK